MEMSKKKTNLVKQKKQPNGTVQSVKLMFIFMFTNSFFSRTIRDWNQLSDELLDID